MGQVLEGQVQANVRTDWYRIDVPAGQNVAAFTLTGEPALSVDAS